jgi:hypothetical protein
MNNKSKWKAEKIFIINKFPIPSFEGEDILKIKEDNKINLDKASLLNILNIFQKILN